MRKPNKNVIQGNKRGRNEKKMSSNVRKSDGKLRNRTFSKIENKTDKT